MILSNEDIKSLLKDVGEVELPVLSDSEIKGIIENEKDVFTYGFFNDVIRKTEFDKNDTPIEKMYKISKEAYLTGAFLQLDSIREILEVMAAENEKYINSIREKLGAALL